MLLAKSHILVCEKGYALIRKGHASRTLYVPLSGSLKVVDDGKDMARVEERGTVVGEVAVFTSEPRSSDVVAGPDGARVFALSANTLREIISSHGPMAAKFLHFVLRGVCYKFLERVVRP